MSKPEFTPWAAGFSGAVLFALAAWLWGPGCQCVAAKDYLIDTWRFDDDLPRDGIMAIGQGEDGYLWVSSRYGLARFDGTRFAKFDATVGALFAGYHYATVTPDRQGTVWIGTPGAGLLAWRDGQLRSVVKPGNPIFGPVLAGFTNAQGKPLMVASDGRVLTWSNGVAELVASADRWGAPVPTSLCQDRTGNLWFVTYQHKLVRITGTNAVAMEYGSADNRRNWIALQTDGTGQLWAGTQREVGCWRGESFEPIASPTESFALDDLIALTATLGNAATSNPSASQTQSSRFWAVALGRAWLWEDGRWMTNVAFETSAGQYETSPRLADREGNLWFATAKGSLCRAGRDGSLLQLTSAEGIPPGRVASLFEDREGSIWAGLEHTGLIRLRERYFTPLGLREGAKAPVVWAVAEDPTGAIWLGTDNGGLQRWQEGKFSQFDFGAAALPGSVYSLCLDRQGSLWVGTGERGVFRLDNGKFVPVWEYPDPGWNKRVYAIYEDRQGRMWFGTGLGLYCWQNGKVRFYGGKGFEMGVTRAMAEDAQGRLWVGLSQGAATRLACLQGDQLVPLGTEAGLVGYDVFGLHAAADGSMWVGTVGDGLWRWHAGDWTYYSTQQGLPDDRVYSINEDGAGHLWLGSPAGIVRLGLSSVAALEAGQSQPLECLLFNRTDGLPTRECSGGAQPALARARDGRLLFAMTQGAVALWPNRVRVNPLPPPVLIEEVRVDGKPQPPPDRPMANPTPPPLALGPGRHVVEFRYTATSLLAPAKVRFKCRLEGVDKLWHEADPARSALYSLTAPGNYRFEVLACNNDGVWNQTGATVALSLAPYWWQTWWFRAGMFAGLLLSVGGSIRFLERRKLAGKLQQLELQQLVEQERGRIARDIHDELGASLTEIGLLSEFAQRASTPVEQVRADVHKIAAKAQTSTRALDEIVWAVNPRNDTLEGFITYASAYAEEHLGLAGIRCRLDAVSPVPAGPLRADLRHHLFLAFKEALNNVIKHAGASQVDLRLWAEPGQLMVDIRDNGHGFAWDPAAGPANSGNGLGNMKERLESLGGSFECTSAAGQGTRVKLTLKID